MKKIIILFAALAAVLSCSKENPSNYNPVDGTYSVTLTASAPGADTKTTLVDGGTEKFVHWSKGDAIKVLFFPNHDNSNTFNGPGREFQSDFETETSEKAYFKTNSWSWGFGSDVVSNRLMENGIVVYPSTAEATSNKTVSGKGSANNTELSFILPDAQKAINGNIESGLNFSYAMVGRDGFKSAIESNRAVDLEFKNACALICLTMPASFEKDVTSITISSNNEVALTGKGNVDMNNHKDEILSPFHVTPEVTETSHTVTLAKADGTPLEAGATYFAVVWPGEHEGLTISFNAADGTVASKPTKPVILTASKVKPYTFNNGLDFESAQIEEGDFIYEDGTTGNNPYNAVAVVFYKGKPQDIDPTVPVEFSRGLAIGLKSYNVKWNASKLSKDEYDSSLKYGSQGDLKNSSVGGWEALTKWLLSVPTMTLYSSNYGSVPDGASVWYHGTHKEWNFILASINDVNEKLGAVSGAQLLDNTTSKKGYWIPLNTGSAAWTVYWDGEKAAYTSISWYDYTDQCGGARPIFAF